jgi:threonine/homoserine efflux transporter RhtA
VTVFGGVVPVLAALVVAAAARRETPVKAMWVAGASPVALAALAVEHVSAEAGPVRAQRLHEAAGSSLRTWLPVQAALAVLPLVGLRRHWRRRRTGAVGGE